MIQEAEEVFLTTLDDLEKEAKKQDIEIVNRQIFKDNPRAVVKNLKLQDARVVVGRHRRSYFFLSCDWSVITNPRLSLVKSGSVVINVLRSILCKNSSQSFV